VIPHNIPKTPTQPFSPFLIFFPVVHWIYCVLPSTQYCQPSDGSPSVPWYPIPSVPPHPGCLVLSSLWWFFFFRPQLFSFFFALQPNELFYTSGGDPLPPSKGVCWSKNPVPPPVQRVLILPFRSMCTPCCTMFFTKGPLVAVFRSPQIGPYFPQLTFVTERRSSIKGTFRFCSHPLLRAPPPKQKNFQFLTLKPFFFF